MLDAGRFGYRVAFSVARRSSQAGVDWDGFGDPAIRGHAPAEASSAAPATIRGEVLTKGTNGEPAVMPGVLIIVPGPINKETEWYATGAFAVDSLTPRTYQIAANAPGVYAALAVEVGADT